MFISLSSSFRRLTLAALFLSVFGAPALAVTLCPQEQAIANYLISDPGQGRPTLILDPVIEAVARARAEDMAKRGYFAHVNPDGHAANYLLRQAGYQLPAYWGTDPTANYVESIAAGYSSASATWTAWMNSPDHKTHLLAENSFFATETHYGVGYYADPSSPYVYYWVVITAPPQPVAINTPADSETVLTGSAALAGTATSGAAAIQYQVANATGTSAWQPAAGTVNWSAEATGLAPGANVVRVQSVDSSGAEIAHATRTITYAVQTPLTVTVSGSGSVTSGFLGTTLRDLGTTVSIQAIPAKGSIFTGWTGSLPGSAPTLTFTMQAGLSLQANFAPNPFGPLTGNYSGAVTSGSAGAEGLLRVTISSAGLLTGRITLNGVSYAFTGRMGANGTATITVKRPDLAPLTLSLQADFADASQGLAGTVTDGTNSLDVSAGQATFNARTNPAPQAGRYTMTLSPANGGDAAQTPQGNGYAVLSVSTSGVATITGRMGDGTPFASSATLTENGVLPLSFVPHGEAAGSSVNGLLTFQSSSVADLGGSLSWTKAPRAKDLFYPAGFDAQLAAVGSLYVVAQKSSSMKALAVAPSGGASASLGDGNLAQPLDVAVNIGSNDLGTMVTPGAPNLSFRINARSGAVEGTFTLPDGNKVRAFRGVLLQKQNAAFGYFQGINQAGYFALNLGN